MEDLDIRDRKAEEKAAKKASEEKKKKQAVETAKTAKARASCKNLRKITSFFTAKSKEQQLMTTKSNGANDGRCGPGQHPIDDLEEHSLPDVQTTGDAQHQ